ncbi:MAG: hypothetical protein JRD92_04485 [Deltaproteobacteria bacterium]|nr:hypothetical protein [Deltaproteobacteria bacterium]MBW1904481.1 hypothetical protein [Deltaproteobacteria bacterium]MBW2158579.1 hypothetical protein [Deltaproteobacteria bacterium]MBW2379479.1 hypothetical protein [Deltaproteobacteria bacterium]MBW2586187.1 hypothetical protein [Deltaproteobacteria bacterium]
MSRLLVLVLTALMLALLASCSDLSTPMGGTGGSGGAAGTGGDGGSVGLVDPEPKTKSIQLGCTDNLSPSFSRVFWEIEVNPGPIVAGEPFGVDFTGRAVFHEVFLDSAQLGIPGGHERFELIELKATVHVRRGATDRDGAPAPDVVLMQSDTIQRTCTYDDDGNKGVGAGPFSMCSEDNDNPDGSNDECTGLGGTPSPDNPCLEFVALPTSNDCEPEGVCDTRDGGFGIKNAECVANGFCVTAPLEIPLEGSLPSYRAAASGSVFFGWDDVSTGATLQEGGRNDGSWILPPAVFEVPTGPNGFRIRIDDLSVATECTMGVNSRGTNGVGSRDLGSSPTPDSKLIWFPIQTR